jgi:hypothetical protein
MLTSRFFKLLKYIKVQLLFFFEKNILNGAELLPPHSLLSWAATDGELKLQ